MAGNGTVRARRSGASTTTTNKRAAALAVAAASISIAAAGARGAAASWDGGGDPFNARWSDSLNWSPDGVPNSTTDVSFGGGVTPFLIVGMPAGIFPVDSFANSITISSTNTFTLDGNTTGTLGIPLTGRLNLTSGDLTRFDIGSAFQWLDIEVMLAGDGLWQVGGTGPLQVWQISETGGARTFTKTGSGLLQVDNGITVTGTKTISQGTLRGAMHGAGAITVSANAVWEITAAPSGPTPVTLFGKPGTLFAPTLVAMGNGVMTGPVTLIDNPTISINPGQVLEFAGGINNGAGNTGFTKLGTGQMVVSGAGSAAGTVLAGQLTVKHNTALGTGTVTVTDTSGGASPPALAFGDGVTNFANPITMSRATLRGVGTSPTVASNITVQAANLTVNVPDAAHLLTLNGNIAESGGAFGLTKTGAGTLSLGGTNTLSAGVTVAEGVLTVSNNNPLHATVPTVVQSGARFELRNTQAISRPLQVIGNGPGGLGAINSGSGNNTLTGQVTLHSLVAFGANAGAVLNVAGPVSGPGLGITKVGDGTLTLTSPLNDFAFLNIADGVFSMTSHAGVPSAVEINVTPGGGVSLFGNGSVNRRVNLDGAGASASVGALDNEAGNNTWVGEVVLLSDSTLSARGGTMTITGNVFGPGMLTKSGPGVVALGGNNSYGNTTVAQGPLTILAASALPPGKTTDVLSGGTLRVGNGVTVGADGITLRINGAGSGAQGALSVAQGSGTWNGPVTIASDGAAVGAAAGAQLTISGVIGDGATPLPLTKVGAGTVVLTGANTYRGGTIVNAGTLAVDTDEALGATGTPITVNAGAKLRVTSQLFTSRAFVLNNGSIEVLENIPLIYDGSTISGGFLRGPGVHAFAGVAPNTLSGVTALPGSKLAHLGVPLVLNNFSNAGELRSNAALTWDGGFNLGGGIVGIEGALATTAFQNDGLIEVLPGATLSNTASDLASTGGSRITIASGGTLQLNGTQLNLHGALAVNNGAIAGGTTNVHFGSMLAGAGSFGTVVVHPGGAFTPGVTLANLAASPPPAITGAIDPLDPNQTVSAPVVLNADTIATVAAAEGTLTLASPLEASGRALTKVGDGTLAVGGLHAAALRVEAGTVAFTPSTAHGGPASTLGTLDIPSPGRVDLANNKLIVTDGEVGTFDGASYSGLTGRIASAYNFGAWDGAGVFTSMPDAQADRGITTIAVATADEVFYAGGTFGGVSTSSGDVLLMYTYAGDLNMDGLVDGADYGVIDNFVQFPGTSGYSNGDFNYDGVIDGADYGIIDTTIQLQGAPIPSGTYGSTPMAAVAAVPEPAAGVTGFLAGAILARRRRR